MPKPEKFLLAVNSTGIKVYGEGEWETRQHGVSKRRTRRKSHPAVDEATGEILSAVVTTNDIHDGSVLSMLLAVVDSDIDKVSANSAYNQMDCYEVIEG